MQYYNISFIRYSQTKHNVYGKGHQNIPQTSRILPRRDHAQGLEILDPPLPTSTFKIGKN